MKKETRDWLLFGALVATFVVAGLVWGSQGLEMAFAVSLVLLVVFLLVGWTLDLARIVFVNGYRYVRWESRGLCYSCHRVLTVETLPVDQLYSETGYIQRLSCSCGKTTGIKPGNRRFAEW